MAQPESIAFNTSPPLLGGAGGALATGGGSSSKGGGGPIGSGYEKAMIARKRPQSIGAT